ncbi:MAG: HEXXH motif-containing putative peptide modification protein [Acidobacteriota bacterium]
MSYRRRLELLGEHLPAALQFLDATHGGNSDRIFADAVVRGSIDDLLRAYTVYEEREPAEEQIAFFEHYSAHPAELERDAADPANSFRQKLVDRPVRYWSDASARTVRDRAFGAMLRQNLPGPRLYVAEEETEIAISQGLALLHELLPSAAPSAVSHLDFLVVDEFYDEVGSATIAPLLGAIFVARTTLRSPWTLAEAILHECMHLKFVEIEHTHSLLPRGYSEQTSPQLHPPWHPETTTWPMNRALTAAHVYVALSVYAAAAEAAAPEFETRFGPWERSQLLTDSNAAAGRAHSLIDLAAKHPESLGKAGKVFLEWMRSVLRNLTAGLSVMPKAV